MGLFSKSKTYIYSSSMLLVADTPDLLHNTVTIAIMNNRSITDDIKDNYINGFAMKAGVMRSYAKKNYTYGLPNGSVGYAPVKTSTVKLILDSIYGIRALIMFNVIDECDPRYYAEEFMQNNRGWDSTTGIVSNPPFSTTETVYFDYAEILTGNQYRIHYTYGVDTTYEDVVTTNLVPGKLYYHVGYYLLDNSNNAVGSMQYWFYQEDTRAYPVLTLSGSYIEESPYYPIIPLRQNSVDLTTDTSTDLYKTSKKCLRYLGSDVDELASGINANPDIGDVDHAYVMMGIDIQSNVQNSIAYLHDYFAYLGKTSKIVYEDFVYWSNHQRISSAPPVNTITISDGSYKMDLSYNYITLNLVTGVIGKKGTAIRINHIRPREEVTEANRSGGTTFLYAYETSSIVFQKQVTATQYEEVEITGIYHTNYVYSNYTVSTSLEDSLDANDDDQNNFLIPVHYTIARAMGLMNHNYLMYDAYRIVFNSKVTVKLKWYQTGFFKFVMIVVAIAITIYSLGSAWESLTAAYAISTTAVVTTIATQIAIAYITQVTANYVTDHYGAIAAIVAAVVVMAVSRNAKVNNLLPSSIDLMDVSSALFTAVDTELAEQTSDIYTDILALEEGMDELNDLFDELTDDVWDNPLELLSKTQSFNSSTFTESPTTFYNRTIHYGNIGTLALQAIDSYVDDQLKLDMPSSQIRLII